MIVLCKNCRTHYDDSYQTKKCPGEVTSHRATTTSPLFEHVEVTRAANGLPFREGPRSDAPSWGLGHGTEARHYY